MGVNMCLQSILINKANVVSRDTSLPSMRTVYSHVRWHVLLTCAHGSTTHMLVSRLTAYTLQHLEVSMVINYNDPELHADELLSTAHKQAARLKRKLLIYKYI